MTIPLSHVGYGAALSIILLVAALIISIAVQLGGRERKARD
jgi:ABC-type sugar transport system permease subunit